jgi:hypothetical protein
MSWTGSVLVSVLVDVNITHVFEHLDVRVAEVHVGNDDALADTLQRVSVLEQPLVRRTFGDDGQKLDRIADQRVVPHFTTNNWWASLTVT